MKKEITTAVNWWTSFIQSKEENMSDDKTFLFKKYLGIALDMNLEEAYGKKLTLSIEDSPCDFLSFALDMAKIDTSSLFSQSPIIMKISTGSVMIHFDDGKIEKEIFENQYTH